MPLVYDCTEGDCWIVAPQSKRINNIEVMQMAWAPGSTLGGNNSEWVFLW